MVLADAVRFALCSLCICPHVPHTPRPNQTPHTAALLQTVLRRRVLVFDSVRSRERPQRSRRDGLIASKSNEGMPQSWVVLFDFGVPHRAFSTALAGQKSENSNTNPRTL
eukprot:2004195-Rhodomonas_salina.1